MYQYQVLYVTLPGKYYKHHLCINNESQWFLHLGTKRYHTRKHKPTDGYPSSLRSAERGECQRREMRLWKNISKATIFCRVCPHRFAGEKSGLKLLVRGGVCSLVCCKVCCHIRGVVNIIPSERDMYIPEFRTPFSLLSLKSTNRLAKTFIILVKQGIIPGTNSSMNSTTVRDIEHQAVLVFYTTVVLPCSCVGELSLSRATSHENSMNNALCGCF